MALLDDVRAAVRVSSKATDSELRMFIETALGKLELVGIKPSMLEEDSLPALVKEAVVCRAKALYGYDVEEREFFWKVYDSIVCDLLNSSANIASGGSDG